MIALFVFSFILLFLLLPHKRVKACISTIFWFFSISHFSSKKSLSSLSENTLKNITTSEFFTYESIKAFLESILLAWFVSIKSWTFFISPVSGTGIIRLIFDCYYYFLVILILTQDLLMVLSSITMTSEVFLEREIFILCILALTVFYQT